MVQKREMKAFVGIGVMLLSVEDGQGRTRAKKGDKMVCGRTLVGEGFEPTSSRLNAVRSTLGPVNYLGSLRTL